nr:thioredoxin-like protein 4B isoform X2 [Chlorocebus sabaeus]
MSFLLPKLTSKKEVDQAIKSTAEKVLVLRFGRDEDPVCLQLDDILSKTSSDLSKMAAIYLVDVDQTPVYTQYFDISYIPSTVFFFNGQHMKVDYGCGSPTSLLLALVCSEEAALEGCASRTFPSRSPPALGTLSRWGFQHSGNLFVAGMNARSAVFIHFLS